MSLAIWFALGGDASLVVRVVTVRVVTDFGNLGYNCVVPWGRYNGGGLVLWQLEMIVELEPGDTFFLMGSLITHNVDEIQGIRNSIDLFCHINILSWKDMCDKER